MSSSEPSTRGRRDADAPTAKLSPVATVAPVVLDAGRPPDEATLIRRLLDGDEVAFSELVEEWHGRLLRLALVFVADRASAEEVVQDTWLAVLTGLRSFEGRSSLKTWIFSTIWKAGCPS